MINNIEKGKLWGKIFNFENFALNSEKLELGQNLLFWLLVLISILVKIYLIPYNMIDSGDNATRVWNAFWWAQRPFFVLPESGHPLWFYFMGPLIKITGEFYYTSIISMIFLMTISGIYIFKSAFLLTDFKTSILTFMIFTLNPVIFRLNFQPYAQQLSLASACIMIYFLLKALFNNKSISYFLTAGIFGFTALASRPEVLFLIIPLAIYIIFSKKKGAWYFALIPLSFQLFWIILSYSFHGSPFKTFELDATYSVASNIQGLSLDLRLMGFFIPYYFLVVGITIILFYFFVKGIMYSFNNYPNSITMLFLMLIFLPLLVNGIAGAKSTLYHTTNYFYLSFFVSPLFCAIGLNKYLENIKQKLSGFLIAALIIISCIPLSYIKEFAPRNYKHLFPKVIQFIVTTDEPEETRKLIEFVDENIQSHPALIFDSEENSSSIFYVPFRTKLAPPEKILVSGYNVPNDYEGLRDSINKFMKANESGIIMFRKSPTLMNRIFGELFLNKAYKRIDTTLAKETDKWYIFTYGQEK